MQLMRFAGLDHAVQQTSVWSKALHLEDRFVPPASKE